MIAQADPSVVLIDSWGFMWRLARELKLAGRPRPAHQADRPAGLGDTARPCACPGEMGAIISFAFTRSSSPSMKWGLPTTVIGNPALGRCARATERRSASSWLRLRISPDWPVARQPALRNPPRRPDADRSLSTALRRRLHRRSCCLRGRIRA